MSPAEPSVASPADNTIGGALGLWDTVSLVIGIVVGVSIFRAPPDVFRYAGTAPLGLFIWGLGGALALCGALCYSELASTYPEYGADYVFLSRAWGRRTGFLFAWMQCCTVLTGSIGAMAFVFADHARNLSPGLESISPGIIAGGALVVLTALQLSGLRTGKRVQNVLSIGKVASLAGLLVCGLWLAPASTETVPVTGETTSSVGEIGLALVFVLYAYGGWNDAATVTPDVRDCRRNMPRALLLSLGLIAVLYLAVNAAYLRTLGLQGLVNAETPAADVIRQGLGKGFSRAMDVIIMVSALGAMNGMLFAGCRLLAAVGRKETLFRRWKLWSARGVPVAALSTLTMIALLLISLVGTSHGRNTISRLADLVALPDPDWEKYHGGFSTLVAATAPIFWSFILLTSLSLIVLRRRDPDRVRPFRVPLYPVTPIIFACSAAFMLNSSLRYAGQLTLLMMPALAGGLVVSQFSRRADDVTGDGAEC